MRSGIVARRRVGVGAGGARPTHQRREAVRRTSAWACARRPGPAWAACTPTASWTSDEPGRRRCAGRTAGILRPPHRPCLGGNAPPMDLVLQVIVTGLAAGAGYGLLAIGLRPHPPADRRGPPRAGRAGGAGRRGRPVRGRGSGSAHAVECTGRLAAGGRGRRGGRGRARRRRHVPVGHPPLPCAGAARSAGSAPTVAVAFAVRGACSRPAGPRLLRRAGSVPAVLARGPRRAPGRSAGGVTIPVRAFVVIAAGSCSAEAAARLLARIRLGRALQAVAGRARGRPPDGLPVERLLTGRVRAGRRRWRRRRRILQAPSTPFTADAGTMLGLKGLVAALLAGFGSPRRAFAAGLAVGVLEADRGEPAPGTGPAGRAVSRPRPPWSWRWWSSAWRRAPRRVLDRSEAPAVARSPTPPAGSGGRLRGAGRRRSAARGRGGPPRGSWCSPRLAVGGPLVLGAGGSSRPPPGCTWPLAAVGLNFAVGLAGIPSLGQGAFVGIGAFAVALLTSRAGWPPVRGDAGAGRARRRRRALVAGSGRRPAGDGLRRGLHLVPGLAGRPGARRLPRPVRGRPGGPGRAPPAPDGSLPGGRAHGAPATSRWRWRCWRSRCSSTPASGGGRRAAPSGGGPRTRRGRGGRPGASSPGGRRLGAFAASARDRRAGRRAGGPGHGRRRPGRVRTAAVRRAVRRRPDRRPGNRPRARGRGGGAGADRSPRPGARRASPGPRPSGSRGSSRRRCWPSPCARRRARPGRPGAARRTRAESGGVAVVAAAAPAGLRPRPAVDEPILRAVGVSVHFGGVVALDAAGLERAAASAIHAAHRTERLGKDAPCFACWRARARRTRAPSSCSGDGRHRRRPARRAYGGGWRPPSNAPPSPGASGPGTRAGGRGRTANGGGAAQPRRDAGRARGRARACVRRRPPCWSSSGSPGCRPSRSHA